MITRKFSRTLLPFFRRGRCITLNTSIVHTDTDKLIDPASSLRAFYGEEQLSSTSTDTSIPKFELVSGVGKNQVTKPSTLSLSVECIKEIILSECEAEISEYEDYSVGIPAITLIISRETTRERLTLAESIKSKFRPFLRNIQSEGMRDEVADWIVLDLKVATLHIMDPIFRRECYLEERLRESANKESNSVCTNDPQYIIDQLTRSLPRKIAGDAGRCEEEDQKVAAAVEEVKNGINQNNPFNI